MNFSFIVCVQIDYLSSMTPNYPNFNIYFNQMNNKIRKQIIKQQYDNQFLCEQIPKNKEDIQQFYLKNKMKFPPILQSRNIFLKPINSNPQKQIIINSPKSIQNQQMKQKKCDQQNQIGKKASICQIVFTKKRKSMDINRQLNDSKASIIQTISQSPRKYYLSQQKSKDLKFLNEDSKNNNVLQRFIQQLNLTRNSKKSPFFLSKNLQSSKEQKQRLKQLNLLSINRIQTQNPQVQMLKTFRGKYMHIQQKSLQQPKVQYTFRQKLKNGFLKKSERLNNSKNIITKRKQLLFLQPWQPQFPFQQDFLIQKNQ